MTASHCTLVAHTSYDVPPTWPVASMLWSLIHCYSISTQTLWMMSNHFFLDADDVSIHSEAHTNIYLSPFWSQVQSTCDFFSRHSIKILAEFRMCLYETCENSVKEQIYCSTILIWIQLVLPWEFLLFFFSHLLHNYLATVHSNIIR